MKLKESSIILVVDDDRDTALSIKVSLELVGYNVEIYSDPKEVLRIFKPNYYDLAMLDIRMPKLNGFELFKILREIDSRLKVCFMTSFVEYYESLRESHPRLDVKCFIQKPIPPQKLIRLVADQLKP
jgi:DNA-binding NtrC family response regulator